MKYYLKFIIPRPIEPEGWVQVPYIVRDSNGRYYYPFEERWVEVSDGEINLRLDNNELEKVSKSVIVEDESALWLSNKGVIWLADKLNPVNDPNKIKVMKYGDEIISSINRESTLMIVQEGESIRTLDKKYVKGAKLYYEMMMGVMLYIKEKYNVKTEKKAHDDIEWDHIATSMYENNFIDFCYDPYFATSSRMTMTNVLKYGYIDKMSIFYHKDIEMYDKMSQNLGDLREIMTIALAHSTSIAVYRDTVSSSEVRYAVKGERGCQEIVHNINDPDKMVGWIKEDHTNRIAIVDAGFVSNLKECIKEEEKEYYKDILIDMREKYPVGIVYVKGDEIWYDVLKEAFSFSLNKMFQKYQYNIWNGDDKEGSIASELKKHASIKLDSLKSMSERYGVLDNNDINNLKTIKEILEKPSEEGGTTEYEKVAYLKEKLN